MEDTNLIIKTENSIMKALDQNGNGEIDIEDIITLAFKTPGVHVTRDNFLQKELEAVPIGSKTCNQNTKSCNDTHRLCRNN